MYQQSRNFLADVYGTLVSEVKSYWSSRAKPDEARRRIDNSLEYLLKCTEEIMEQIGARDRREFVHQIKTGEIEISIIDLEARLIEIAGKLALYAHSLNKEN